MKLSAPLIVNWTLSYTCNFSCKHCYSRSQKRKELPLDKVFHIVDELARCRVNFVNFGGGEPLLYPHIYEVTARGAEKGLGVSMNTNGWLLNDESAKKIKEAGFRSVGISIDGASDSVHDEFRNRNGSFEQALAGLEHLKKADVPSTVSTVIFRKNYKSWKQVAEMVAERGANTLYLHNFKCSGRGMENREELDLEPLEWKAFYEEAFEYSKNSSPLKIAFDDPILALLGQKADVGAVKGSTCGKLSLHIEPDGDATPCGFIPLSVGNLLEQSLEEIWEKSPILEKMRNKTPKGKCKSCSAYGECVGGCTARSLAVSGEFNNPDPHCWKEED